MKSTGIIRRVDELGRVVIPIELRNKFGIAEKDPIEIYVEGTSIVLRKHEQTCIFCGNPKNLTEYKRKLICDRCAKKITALNTELNSEINNGNINISKEEAKVESQNSNENDIKSGIKSAENLGNISKLKYYTEL